MSRNRGAATAVGARVDSACAGHNCHDEKRDSYSSVLRRETVCLEVNGELGSDNGPLWVACCMQQGLARERGVLLYRKE